MSSPVSLVFLSLGSNLGDRLANLHAGLNGLHATAGIDVKRVSTVYETEPLGNVEQPAFLNLVASIETDLEPLELLHAVKSLEVALGRTESVHWGPRRIDIDIVLWGDRRVDTPTLTIPHREFRTRAFVLFPLRELAPEFRDPVTLQTVSELAQRPEVQGNVVKLDPHVIGDWTAPLGAQ